MSGNVFQVTDPVADRTACLIERLFPSPRRFALKLWDQGALLSDGKVKLPMSRADLYLPA